MDLNKIYLVVANGCTCSLSTKVREESEQPDTSNESADSGSEERVLFE